MGAKLRGPMVFVPSALWLPLFVIPQQNRDEQLQRHAKAINDLEIPPPVRSHTFELHSRATLHRTLKSDMTWIYYLSLVPPYYILSPVNRTGHGLAVATSLRPPPGSTMMWAREVGSTCKLQDAIGSREEHKLDTSLFTCTV